MSRSEKELKNRHLTFKIDLNQMKKAAPTGDERGENNDSESEERERDVGEREIGV